MIQKRGERGNSAEGEGRTKLRSALHPPRKTSASLTSSLSSSVFPLPRKLKTHQTH